MFNTTATTVNFAGAATALNVGATTGTITFNNPTVVGSQTTQNVFNTTATTVNFAGAATDVQIGATSGTTNVNNNLVVDLDLQVKGGDITTDQTTFNLLNTTATTVNFAGGATDVQIGTTSGTTNVNNNLVVDLDLEVKGGDITTDQTTFNLLNTTATTINFAGGANTVNIGSSGTTTNIGILTLSTDLEVQYGGTGVSTFTENGIVYGDTASPMKVTDAAGTSDTSVSFQILTVTSDVDATPVWTDTIDGGSF